MNEGFIQKIIQRSNRLLMVVGLIAIVITAGLLALNSRYLYNFILGPIDADPVQLLALQAGERPQRYWLNVRGEELLDTGIQYVTTSDFGKETVDYSYMALVIEDRLLLVKYAGEVPATTIEPALTGWIVPISADEQAEVIQAVEAEVPQVAGAFLPYEFQTGNFRADGIFWLAIALAAIVFGIWAILTAFNRGGDRARHPILKALARFGPLDFVISRIESELAGPHEQIGGLHLTNAWLVFDGKTNLSATRHEDITWVYKHVLTQRSYGIAVGKTFSAMVYDRHGVQLTINAGRKEADVERMLQAIFARAPWAISGYAPELEQAWKKDRPGFLAEVDRRKAGVVQ
jgi:hypothetical protein